MIFNDRVRQQTNTIGTADYSLLNSITGFESFADSFTDGDETSYCVTDGDQYEVGHGIITNSGTVLTRHIIIRSSNSNQAVSWLAGLKDIFCTVSSAFIPRYGSNDPTHTENPAFIGAEFINLNTGSIWICTDNTTDANIWMISGRSAEDITGEIVSMVIAFSV